VNKPKLKKKETLANVAIQEEDEKNEESFGMDVKSDKYEG